jgi:hypothetical protein
MIPEKIEETKGNMEDFEQALKQITTIVTSLRPFLNNETISKLLDAPAQYEYYLKPNIMEVINAA